MKGLNSSLESKLFDRPSKYIMGLPGGESDYTINDYPVWVESIDSTEFMNLGNIFPNISQMGLISPFCTALLDKRDQTKLLGYIILIPYEYYDDQKLYEFILGHELGHVSQNHLVNVNCKLINDINKEIEADNFSLTRYQDGYLTIDDYIVDLNKMFDISISLTIKTIPSLNKKYRNKIDKVISRFKKCDKTFKQRLDAISKLR